MSRVIQRNRKETGMNVTVTRVGKPGRDAILKTRYTIAFDALPGKTFGPWSFLETRLELTVSALLETVEARALLFDAYRDGSASCPVGYDRSHPLVACDSSEVGS